MPFTLKCHVTLEEIDVREQQRMHISKMMSLLCLKRTEIRKEDGYEEEVLSFLPVIFIDLLLLKGTQE